MADICPACKKYFDRPDGYDKHICTRCAKKAEEEKRAKELEEKRQREIEQDTRTYVVIFLSVDSPSELFRGTRAECEKVSEAIYNGTYEKYAYLKESQRLRVWLAEAIDNPKGRTIIPVGTMDGLQAEDFDPSHYE